MENLGMAVGFGLPLILLGGIAVVAFKKRRKLKLQNKKSVHPYRTNKAWRD